MKKAHFLLTAVAAVATILGAGIAAAQDVYVSDTSSPGNSLTVITPGGGTSVLTSSDLDDPTGLAFDGANLFIADSGNGDITEYDTTTGKFSIFATSGLANPQGLAFDSNGNLYVADQGSNSISAYLGGSSTATPYTSGLNTPSGIAVDSLGDLYVTLGNNEIARIDPGGTSVQEAGTSNVALNGPDGVVIGSDGNLYVVNTNNPSVEKATLNFVGSTYLSNTPTYVGLDGSRDLIFDDNGNLYVSDFGNNSVTEYNDLGALVNTFSTNLNGPTFLAIGPGPAVPEPSTYVLLLAGLGTLYFYQRRRSLAPIKL